jgi:hypothetical protein
MVSNGLFQERLPTVYGDQHQLPMVDFRRLPVYYAPVEGYTNESPELSENVADISLTSSGYSGYSSPRRGGLNQLGLLRGLAASAQGFAESFRPAHEQVSIYADEQVSIEESSSPRTRGVATMDMDSGNVNVKIRVTTLPPVETRVSDSNITRSYLVRQEETIAQSLQHAP